MNYIPQPNSDWQIRATQTEVFVASACKGMLLERLKLIRLLHEAGIKTESSEKNNPRLLNQLQVRYSIRLGSPLCVFTAANSHANTYRHMWPTSMCGSVFELILHIWYSFSNFADIPAIFFPSAENESTDGKELKIISPWHFQYAEDNQISLVVLIGESEVMDGVVKVREVTTREEATVKREDLVTTLRQKLGVRRYYTYRNFLCFSSKVWVTGTCRNSFNEKYSKSMIRYHVT